MICSFDNHPNYFGKDLVIRYMIIKDHRTNQKPLDFPHSILRRGSSLGTDASFQGRKMGFK